MHPTRHLLKATTTSIANKKTIAILGSAIAGPSLALQILSHPILSSLYTPLLYDRSADPLSNSQSDEKAQSAGAAVALSANGLFPLYQLGLRQSIEEKSSEFGGANFWRSGYREREWRWLNGVQNATWRQDLRTGWRIIERRDLQGVILRKVKELGGDVEWGRKVIGVLENEGGKMGVQFEGGESVEADLVVGADGGWSEVRRHILRERGIGGEKWEPPFMGQTGFYGISALGEKVDKLENWDSTHGVWLDRGNLSTSPLPGGKIRWDLIIPEKAPPTPSGIPESENFDEGKEWESKIAPGAYPKSETIEILRKHVGVYHPVTETFGKMLAASERIIRTPLRQQVWEKEEIQCGNVVLIGDASRLMLPSSGQGTAFAIEDATVLSNCLLNNPPERGSFARALEAYADARLPRSKKMATTAYYAGFLGQGERWYWRLLRDYGTAWFLRGEDGKLAKKQKKEWPFDDRFEVKLASEAR